MAWELMVLVEGADRGRNVEPIEERVPLSLRRGSAINGRGSKSIYRAWEPSRHHFVLPRIDTTQPVGTD